MKPRLILLLILIPILLAAQSGLNVTGRASLRTTYVDYDETSKIKPDSIADDQYSKTYVIPGFAQSLNLALFARTQSMDITFLSDIQNNPWNQLNSIQNIGRVSLSARFGQNEIILGDFFDSGSEFFIQSREVRGAKLDFRFENLWSKFSYIRTKVSAGEVQKAFGIGSRLQSVYHQYENAGQFRRYFGSAVVHTGDNRYFDLGLKYLYGKDDQGSISESINEPLTNQNMGASLLAFLWKKHLQLFAEGYLSKKDTITANGIEDHAYKAGIDFRYGNFKFQNYYQRLGYDYYSAGYPFLQNDRQGFALVTGYYFPQVISLTFEGEQYKDNLNDDVLLPVTETRNLIAGFTTHFKNWPEFSLKWRYRDDKSDVIMDSVKTDRINNGVEGGIAYSLDAHRLSLSVIYMDLQDKSVLVSGTPLGTEQFISSLNFYSRPITGMFLSGGAVYSTLALTNDQENQNIYAYISSRWDIIANRLKLEASVNYIKNDAANGGNQDMLSNYDQFGSEFSLEYFFNSNLSFKLIGGNDFRNMGYSLSKAQEVIADADYGPLFFNGYEDYKALKYGAEINWIF